MDTSSSEAALHCFVVPTVHSPEPTVHSPEPTVHSPAASQRPAAATATSGPRPGRALTTECASPRLGHAAQLRRLAAGRRLVVLQRVLGGVGRGPGRGAGVGKCGVERGLRRATRKRRAGAVLVRGGLDRGGRASRRGKCRREQLRRQGGAGGVRGG